MKNILRVNMTGALLVIGLFWLLPPDAPVADAAKRNDLEGVRALVKSGADVNSPQGDGMTALHWAAVRGNVEMTQTLLYAGASVSATTRMGSYTPLHLASELGRAAVVKTLLVAGADANALTSTGGVTPLQFAAGAGDVETIGALLDHGADVDLAEHEWGHTPLMFAAAKNRADAVRLLLQRGADPALAGTVVDLSQRNREDREDQRLRDERLGCYGGIANQGVRCRTEPPEPTDVEPRVPGKPVLRPLGQADQIGGYGGLTALTLAAREGNVAATRALLEGGAAIDQVTTGDHTTPLLIAAINGHFDLAMELLERGADPNLASDAGNTPLFATISRRWAPDSEHPEPTDYMQQQTTYLHMMEALLEAGANPNARLNYHVWHIEIGGTHLGIDWIGSTPFVRAAHGTDVEAMKLLVQYGADPNIPIMRPAEGRRPGGGARAEPVELDPSGLPPVPVGGPGIFAIHAASGFGHGVARVANIHNHVANGWLPAVKYLVEDHGADVNARDFTGSTPLHHAAARGDNALILYLVSKGADVTAVNRRGQTTVDMANGPIQRIEPYPETIKLLEGLGAKNNHKCVSC